MSDKKKPTKETSIEIEKGCQHVINLPFDIHTMMFDYKFGIIFCYVCKTGWIDKVPS